MSALRMETPPSVEAFIDVCPAQVEPCRRLWRAVAETDAALLVVDREAEADLCGELYGPSTRSVFSVVATIDRATGPEGAFLLADGASSRELDEVIQQRRRAETRLRGARFGAVDDNPSALEDVVDRLDERVRSRAPMETSFDDEWLPKSLVRLVVSPEPERDDTRRDGRPEGARQASLGGL